MLLLTGCSHIHIVFLPTSYHYNLICAILTVSYLCLLIEYLAGLHLSHPAVSFQLIIVCAFDNILDHELLQSLIQSDMSPLEGVQQYQSLRLAPTLF